MHGNLRGIVMESNVIAAMLLLILGTGSMGCAQSPQPRILRNDAVLEAWLTCEECTNGELETIVRAGQSMVSPLAEALRAGPTQDTLDGTRRRLTGAYQSMVEYAKTHPDAPVPMSEREYVDRHLENFIVMYQSHAATGLGAIGGAAAKDELTKASALPLRQPVLTVVRETLQRLQ